jgi:hypothetical protein
VTALGVTDGKFYVFFFKEKGVAQVEGPEFKL